MLDFFSYLSFGALPFMEKRSFMSGRIGERVMGENISIWDDGLDERGLPDGLRLRGRAEAARRLHRERRREGRRAGTPTTPAKQGGDARSTGHALPAGATIGPMPLHLFMAPGDASRDDMIEDVKRGIWVSRFWYTRTVHPLNVVVTGMTRDGTFLIEDGKIVGPVRDLRFTQGYVDALNHVDAVGTRPDARARRHRRRRPPRAGAEDREVDLHRRERSPGVSPSTYPPIHYHHRLP